MIAELLTPTSCTLDRLPTTEEAVAILKSYWDDPMETLRQVLCCLRELGDLPGE